MSGIDDLMAESNDRWARAKRRSQEVSDNGLGKAVRTYFTVYLPLGGVALVVAGALLASFAFGVGSADWLVSLAFGLYLMAFGAAVGGLVYNAKRIRPAAELGRFGVLVGLEDHEQKSVRRQVLGKARIDPRHLDVARGAAVQMRKNLATQLVWAPVLGFGFLAQSVAGRGLLGWVMLAGTCLYAISIVFLVREFRQIGRFLAKTAS